MNGRPRDLPGLPRVVRWILGLCLVTSDREVLIGDLEENWDGRAAWLWCQVVALLWTHGRFLHAGRQRVRVLAANLCRLVQPILEAPSMGVSIVDSAMPFGVSRAVVLSHSA